MEKDIEHWPKLHPPASTRTIQAYNSLACQMEGIFGILKEDPADAEHQIFTRFLSLVNKSSRFTVDLCLNLANACEEASTRIEMISIPQQRQQETASITERFITFRDKGKGAVRNTPGISPIPEANSARTGQATPATQAA